MRIRRALSLLTTVGLVAAMFATTNVTTASAAADRLSNTQTVDTDMRCRANAPVVGAVDADQTLTDTMTGPKYIEQGGTFDLVQPGSETDVPSEESGQTVVNLNTIVTKTRLTGGFTIVSATPTGGSYKATPTDAPGPIPGGVTVTTTATDVQMALPGPFPANSAVTAPDIDIKVLATGAPGTKIASKLGGTLTAANPAVPFADSGFSLTANITGIISGSVPTYCAPNYGTFANGNGEPFGTQPNLSETTIIPNTNPLVDITSPLDGAKYLPDAQVFADYACTETVYALSSCEATATDGSQLDFSTFGQKTFTVTATDVNGGSTAKTVTYDVGGNVTPVVDAGPDQTVNGGTTVTLHGAATDPDTGQVLSYNWDQISGPTVALTGHNANDPFDPDQTFVAPRPGPADLGFRLRVDDGFDTGQDTVIIHVNGNQSPVITNGTDQTLNNVKTLAPVTLNATATDPESDTPLSYAWTQVDGSGNPIDSGDPLAVTLTTPNAATAGFTSPGAAATLHFKVVVTDSLGAATTGTVTVNTVASGVPVANAGPDQSTSRAKVVTLDGSGSSDPDADPITYQWTQVDGAGAPLDSGDPLHVTLSSATAQKPTFTAPTVVGDPQVLHFALTVTDVPYGNVSTSDTVDITDVPNVAPTANAGAAQTGKAANAVVTLNGSGSSDPDVGDSLTYAWVQVDPTTNAPLAPGDPTKVTLNNAAVASPTFLALHFAASTTVKFQLIVTDSKGAASDPAFTTVQINANRAPTVGTTSSSGTKTVGGVVTVTVPASAADADTDPVSGFTYQWIQTASATATTACAPSCPNANVTLTPVSGTPRSATFVAPPFTVAGESLFFRLNVTDGFGAAVQSANLTVALTNTVPAVQFSVRPKQMTATNSTVNATTSNQVYAGQQITLDATQNPTQTASTTDADGTTGFTYLWTNVTTSGGTTACTSNCIFGGTTATSTQAQPVFTLPSVGGPQFFMRLVVTDSAGGASAATTFSINRLANTAPTVGTSGPAFVAAGTTGVAITGTATDPQTTATPVQTLTYQWTQVDGGGNPLAGGDPLSVTINNPTTLTPTFDAPGATGTLHFKLSVTDGSATVSATRNIDVSPAANQPPTADAGPDQADVAPGATVTLDGSGSSDPEGQAITYAWTQVDGAGNPIAPTVTLSSATAQKPTFTAPAALSASTLHFQLVVSDPFLGVSAPNTVDIAVDANGVPTANAGPNQTNVPASSTVTLDGSGSSDPESGALTYAWTQVDAGGNPVPAGPGKVTLSSATAQKPTFTAPGTGPASLHFQLVVTDQFGAASPADTVDIGIKLNFVPTANAGADQVGIAAGATVTLDGSISSDPEDGALTYAWTQVDAGGNAIAPTVTLSSATAQQPTFTAPGDGPETLHFKLVVTDPLGAASPADTVDISIIANGAPTAAAGSDQSGIAPGATVTLDGSGSSDPESGALTYAWTQVDGGGAPLTTGPEAVTLSSATAKKPTFTAPALLAGATLHFQLVVTDQFGAASPVDSVDITVIPNLAPTADAGPNQTGIVAGTTVTLNGAGSSDPESGAITYAWTQVDGAGAPIAPTVTLSSATAQKPTFSAPANLTPSSLHFQLVVTDQFGAPSSADTVDIDVAANGVPTASAGPNQTGVAPNTTVTLDGSASADPETQTITYAWTQVDGAGNPVAPTVTLSSATAQKPTFTAPVTPTGTTLRFRLVVTDQYGAASAPAFVLISVGFNTRPVANAGPDQNPGRGKLVTLDGSGSSDAEGTPITYQWVQTDAGGSPVLPGDPLAVTLSSSTAQKPTFTAPVAVGDLYFRLFVTDTPGLISDPDVVVVHLAASLPPVANAGAAQTNKATNSTVTLSGAGSTDPDGDSITSAWTQVDPTTNAPVTVGDPTRVTLSNPAAASPTFVAPHFAASTTLKFQLVVTDVPYGLNSDPAFTTVQINANRTPTLATPSSSGTKTVGGTVTVTVAAPANDADGDPAAGYTYQWIQTASAADTTSCGTSCPNASVTLTPVAATPRSATFTAPAFTVAGESLFFRLNVTDGFGAAVQSSNLTVALTNSAPTVPTNLDLVTGIDGSVHNPTNIYVGAPITISAPSTDPDGGTLTYAFSGRPCGGLGESLGCLLAGNNDSGYPGGSCRGITITNDGVVPGKASFTAPTFGANNPTRCGLQVVVTDAFGSATTRTFTSYNLLANTAPVAVISTVPDKVLASTPAGPSVLVLSGTGSTDADQTPPQPHSYAWEELDAATGLPVPVGSPARGTFSNPNSVSTTWTAPSTAPYSVKFQLTVSDGMSLPSVATTAPVGITTSRPGANAGNDRLTNPGQLVTLDGTGSTDAGNRPLTYSWSQVSGPPVTLTAPLSSSASFTAPNLQFGDPSQVFVFELTTRNGLAASFDTMTVVNDPYGRAVADAGADQAVATATHGVQLDGSGSATSSTGALTYQWVQTGGPTVSLSSATAQKPTFNAPVVTQAQGPQHLTFSLVVGDGFSTSEAATTTVTVNPALEVPGAPTGVTVVRGNGSATVTFTPGIDGGSPIGTFLVGCLSGNGGNSVIVFSPATGTTVTGLTNGKNYNCVVAGVNAIGTGAISAASAAFIPSAPPAAPTNVSAVPGDASATVTFTPGATGGEPTVLYVVTCTSSNGGVARSALVGPGPAAVTGLTNGKTYTCTVYAIHALGTSPVSAPSSSFVVGVAGAPAAPSTLLPGNGQATVSWAAPAVTNGSPATGYVVTPYIGTTAQPAQTFASAATTQVVTGLANGTAYTFTVAAVNARGTGAASAKSGSLTVGTPSAPATAAGKPGNATATVTWTAAVNNGAAISGYLVTPVIGTTAQAPQLFAGAGTTQTVTGLTNGTTYTFIVSAVNSRGTGPGTTSGSVLVGAPGASPLITATAGNGQATVTWTAPANNGSPITGYVVTPIKAGVAQTPITYTASPLSRTITGLTHGASYTFRVVAINARGTGPSSAVSNAVTPT